MEKKDIKKVFIAGGTGFLGYYSCLEFIKQGVEVNTISLPDISTDWLPKEIGVIHGNLFKLTKEELVKLFKGYDALVYAVGPDDRVHAPKEEGAYNFFYSRLVTSVVKVFEAAKEAGVKKAVLLNSYFAYFDRKFPERKLAAKNPYIKVRVEQSETLIKTGGGVANGGMDVVVLELPYIFGSMPKRMPLWKDVFLDRFAKLPAIYFPKGGTNMIHVTGVAEAVVASTFFGQHGDRLPIGKENHKYKFMINEMMECCGAKKRYVGVPTWMATIGGYSAARKIEKEGFETGLDYRKLMKDIQSKDYYIPEEEMAEVRKHLRYNELGYTGGLDIKDGIKKTMIACYPHRFDENGNLLDKWNGINPTKNEPKDNDPDLKK